MRVEGESTHIGVFNLCIHGSLVVVKGKTEKEALKLRGKALRGRHVGIMDSSKFGVMKCFVEDVVALLSEHAFASSHHVIDACHL